MGVQFHHCFQHSTEISSHSSQTRRRNKRHPNRKGENKTLISCRQHDSVNKPYNSIKKLLDLINVFSKRAGYKVNIQKLKAFLYTNNEVSKREIRGGNSTYYNNKKNKVPRNKFNWGDKRPVLGKLQNTEQRNQGRYK